MFSYPITRLHTESCSPASSRSHPQIPYQHRLIVSWQASNLQHRIQRNDSVVRSAALSQSSCGQLPPPLDLCLATNVTHPPGSYFSFEPYVYVRQGCKMCKMCKKPFSVSELNSSEYCCSTTFRHPGTPESESVRSCRHSLDSPRIPTYAVVSRRALRH